MHLRKAKFCCCVLPKESTEIVNTNVKTDIESDSDLHHNYKFDQCEISEDEDEQPDCVEIPLKSTGNIFSLFENEVLDKHNEYRSLHGSPPLVLDMKLCNYARDWAVLLGHTNSFVHRKKPVFGENLFFSPGFITKGNKIVDKWYKEMVNYDFDNPGPQKGTRNFTQMIWKHTKMIGAGVMRLNRRTWVVCNYDPPGNIRGSYAMNVLPKQIQHSEEIENQENISSEAVKQDTSISKGGKKTITFNYDEEKKVSFQIEQKQETRKNDSQKKKEKQDQSIGISSKHSSLQINSAENHSTKKQHKDNVKQNSQQNQSKSSGLFSKIGSLTKAKPYLKNKSVKQNSEVSPIETEDKQNENVSLEKSESKSKSSSTKVKREFDEDRDNQ